MFDCLDEILVLHCLNESILIKMIEFMMNDICECMNQMNVIPAATYR